MSDSLPPYRLQHARLLCPPLSPGVCSNSCPLSQWCYLAISSSAAPFSFSFHYFPALGSFPMSWLFTSGGQSTGASAWESVLPMNIQGWFLLGLSALIFAVQGTQVSSLENPSLPWNFPFYIASTDVFIILGLLFVFLLLDILRTDTIPPALH